VIVDDVMTTGATLNDLATILRRQGAARVDGWIVVRTLPQAGDRHTPVSGSR
jgi:predicted amidophosphoribosyltransferase